MANKVILLTSSVDVISSLELYRDISLQANYNQANILKTYREVVPTAWLVNNTITAYLDEYDHILNEYVEKSHLTDIFDVADGKDYKYTYGQIVLLSSHSDIGISKPVEVEGLSLYFNQKCLISAKGEYNFDEITPAVIKTDIDDNLTGELTNVFLNGEMSALTFVKQGFPINVQYDNTFYEEIYGDSIDNYIDFLKAEAGSGSEVSSIITEETVTTIEELKEQLLLLENEGDISSYNNWKELQQWNPYKLAKLVNVKAVFNSLNNIFTWTPGERILNPEFGTNLRKILYQGITDYTSELIISEIRRCISEYEPRVQVQDIRNSSTVEDTENNTIQIDIVFTIPSLSKALFVYSYTYNQYDQG